MNIVIVEDSRLARAELRTLLAAHPDCEIVAEAADVASAVDALGRCQPDLLLLDIHLPGGSGFDVLDALDAPPAVVFTTAYDQHALAAFARGAVDYLLKPIAPARLAETLTRVRQRQRPSAPPPGGRKTLDDTVFIRDGERCWFVRLADIAGFEACGNYAQAWFDGKQPLIARTLTQLEERLDEAVFFRASRSHLVNLHWVDAVTPTDADGYLLTLRDGHRVPVSRRQAKLLRERLAL